MSARRPYVIGLTGSIGMGKTETARLFAQLGIPVYDADAAVHRLYDRGGAVVNKIGNAFPDCVIDGRVDRERLSARVAAEVGGLQWLEAIVHPLVAKEQQAFIAQAAQNGADMVVLDIPLLYETGGHDRVDAAVVVSAPEDVQRTRVLNRPGMTPEKLDHILARQLPDVDKRARAHFVVETGKGFEHAFAQVKDIVAALRQRRLKEAAGA